MSDSSDVGAVIYKKGEDESEQDDIWDDTELITAYDKAVNLAYDAAHTSLKLKGELTKTDLLTSHKKPLAFEENLVDSDNLHNSPSKKSKSRSKRRKNRKNKLWKVGDECMAKFSEDGLYYPGTIVSLDRSVNKCTIRFDEYDNEEDHSLYSLRRLSEWNAEGDSGEESNSTMDVSSSNESSQHKIKSEPKFLPPTLLANWTHASHEISGSTAVPLLPPPIPPALLHSHEPPSNEEAMSSMLLSWYMNGYHTGYYQAMKDLSKKRNKME